MRSAFLPQGRVGPPPMQQQVLMQTPQTYQQQSTQYRGPPPQGLGFGYSLPGGGGPPNVSAMGMMPQQVQQAPELVRNVWKWGLEDQMKELRHVIERYKYISVDCKFPGIVARPIGSFKSTSEYHYQTLRSNVDILEMIQVGLTLSDEFGNHPVGAASTWQFNFKFDRTTDMCSSDGVELLRQSGLDLAKHEADGIELFAFAELLLSSGLVLDPSVNWITYHSGYDLGYLLSIMLNKEVPVEEGAFLKTLKKYFPSVYDVKYISKALGMVQGKNSLVDVAEEMNIRLPTANANGLNQAGPDSLLTDGIFFEIKRVMGKQVEKFRGFLFGLGEDPDEKDESPRNNIAAAIPQASQVLSQLTGKQDGGLAGTNAASMFQFGKMGGGT